MPVNMESGNVQLSILFDICGFFYEAFQKYGTRIFPGFYRHEIILTRHKATLKNQDFASKSRYAWKFYHRHIGDMSRIKFPFVRQMLRQKTIFQGSHNINHILWPPGPLDLQHLADTIGNYDFFPMPHASAIALLPFISTIFQAPVP